MQVEKQTSMSLSCAKLSRFNRFHFFPFSLQLTHFKPDCSGITLNRWIEIEEKNSSKINKLIIDWWQVFRQQAARAKPKKKTTKLTFQPSQQCTRQSTAEKMFLSRLEIEFRRLVTTFGFGLLAQEPPRFSKRRRPPDCNVDGQGCNFCTLSKKYKKKELTTDRAQLTKSKPSKCESLQGERKKN